MKPRIEVRYYPGHYEPPHCMSLEIDKYILREVQQKIDYPKRDANVWVKMICTHTNVIKRVEYDRAKLTEVILSSVKMMLGEILSGEDTIQGYKKEALRGEEKMKDE
uniref:Uncharacterized protein n=1 Tax=viral metagenome TaxID=1070528 RepID=A0A6M3JB33_9ZZZZ